MRLQIANRLNEVFAALDRVDGALHDARLAGSQRGDIRLVLEELMVNTIHHGYPDGRNGQLELHLRIDPESVTVELGDDAAPFDPLAHPGPNLPGDLADRHDIGGLGVHLVRALASDVRYSHDARGNRLVVRFSHPSH
jgi:serine/threonine-protein kinase RsbW